MAKGINNKKETKNNNDKPMKVMKATTEDKIDFTGMRKMFNQILLKNKGLTLVENKHGAVQVKAEGRGLLFSARSNGKMIITHPIMDGKTRVFKHSGDKWDHFSDVPFEHVTLKMLQDRIADPKTGADYFKQFYGKKIEDSGLFQKAEAARIRAEKLKKETGTKKQAVKASLKEAKKVKEAKVPEKKATKITAKAIRRVAAKATA